ncbi:hypothetical protein PN36_21700 [Candidatus Thiomargarita nelsonii]|uniref:Uncharacterized protein n=1 Tax=Candidatus Thiomargarita nelsonii TaxID=1003181 RepID=A0A0A6P9F5_9GAMM|nr:hypothetical protein PN36_21700 [Candidatus Thiomargarita nelsonii]
MRDKMFEPLDDYEKELMEELEKGHFKSIENFEEEKERYSRCAKSTAEEIEELSIFKEKLKEQTGMDFIYFIHKVVVGDITLKNLQTN